MRRLGLWIATGLGIGYLPGLPPTYASAVTAALYLIPADTASRIAIAGILVALGFWSSEIGVRHFRDKDPRPVVIDEISAQYLTLLLQGASGWKAAAAGFLLFRFFDGLKPLGLRKLETLPGGIGVMADDLGAALLSGLILRAAGPLLGL